MFTEYGSCYGRILLKSIDGIAMSDVGIPIVYIPTLSTYADSIKYG